MFLSNLLAFGAKVLDRRVAATVSQTEIFPVSVIGLPVKGASSKGTSIGSCWAKDAGERESQQNKTKNRGLMGASRRESILQRPAQKVYSVNILRRKNFLTDCDFTSLSRI